MPLLAILRDQKRIILRPKEKFHNNHENKDVKCVEELKQFGRLVTMYPVIVSVLVLASTVVSSTPPPPRIRSLSGQVMV